MGGTSLEGTGGLLSIDIVYCVMNMVTGWYLCPCLVSVDPFMKFASFISLLSLTPCGVLIVSLSLSFSVCHISLSLSSLSLCISSYTSLFLLLSLSLSFCMFVSLSLSLCLSPSLSSSLPQFNEPIKL